MTSHLANYPNQPASSEEMLDALQRDAFGYFLHETNPANGLVADKTQSDAPASIAAVGFALAAYPVGVERSWMTRAEAAERTLAVLRFFWNSPQGTAPDATGYKGFYYHFLDMKTGQRAGKCELSTVDTAFLLAGMLTAAIYFDQDGSSVFQGGVPGDYWQVLLQVQLQFDFPERLAGQARLDLAVPLRDQLGAGRIGVREPPLGLALAADAALPLHRHGITAGGIRERLAVRKTKDENENERY